MAEVYSVISGKRNQKIIWLECIKFQKKFQICFGEEKYDNSTLYFFLAYLNSSSK